MTHSSHRFTTLSADDVALCRAHSEAIDDARESRALQRWIDAVAPLVTPVMSVRAFEVGNHMPADLPMPPSYWDDLEHWLKTLAPAKPAAEQSEADKPAQQPAQKASTHLVCIEAHSCKVTGKKIPVGRVSALTEKQRPDCWLPCDESGWVTHVPTADSVCPVPEGLDFAAMWCDGDVSGLGSRYFREHVNTWRSNQIHGGMRAWRPIAQS